MEIRETAGRVFIENKRSSHQEIPPLPPLSPLNCFLKLPFHGDSAGDILSAVLIEKELPDEMSALPSSCPSALSEAMRACLDFAPASRPSFSQLAQELGSPCAAVAAHLEALTLTPEVLPSPCLLPLHSSLSYSPTPHHPP